MKILIVGAPGSGKTWLAKKLEVEFNLFHIEGDHLYWEKDQEVLLERFRLAVREELVKKRWVYEGHIGKVFDIVSAQTPVMIVIKENSARDFSRSLKKDLYQIMTGKFPNKSVARIKHHFRFWRAMKTKREELIKGYESKNPSLVIYWDGTGTSLNKIIQKLKHSEN